MTLNYGIVKHPSSFQVKLDGNSIQCFNYLSSTNPKQMGGSMIMSNLAFRKTLTCRTCIISLIGTYKNLTRFLKALLTFDNYRSLLTAVNGRGIRLDFKRDGKSYV